MIEVKINLDLSDLVAQFEQAVNEAEQESLDVAQAAIEDKTASGLDADGSPMPAYSESWKKRRAKAGLQTSRRDLRYTHAINNASDSLMISFVKNGRKLTVTEAARGKAEGNQARSEFFAVGEDTEQKIVEVFEDKLSKIQ